MLNTDEEMYQREQLERYRNNLRLLLSQVSSYGGEDNIPIKLLNDLVAQRKEIARIKIMLRKEGLLVADQPDDTKESLPSIGKITPDMPLIQKKVAIQMPSICIKAKQKAHIFDVFLCYNSADRAQIRKIAEQLKSRGILPWFDEWEARPGYPWQRLLEQQIESVQAAAVFVGDHGFGPWQMLESEAFLREFIARECPVIPVLLNTIQNNTGLPIFLRGMRWVDLCQQEPDPIAMLIQGIIGIH